MTEESCAINIPSKADFIYFVISHLLLTKMSKAYQNKLHNAAKIKHPQSF